jgi:hypothetical protein
MVLQIILLLVLSITVVIWPSCFVYLLHGLHRIYAYLVHWFGLIFSHSTTGQLVQSTLALLLVPLFIGVICMIVLKLMQKKNTTIVMQVVWVVWMLLVATVVLR